MLNTLLAVKRDTNSPTIEHTPQIILNNSMLCPPFSFSTYYYSIAWICMQLNLSNLNSKTFMFTIRQSRKSEISMVVLLLSFSEMGLGGSSDFIVS